MPFPAKFPSTCIKCSNLISRGQQIGWNRVKGSKAQTWHHDCSNPDWQPSPAETHTGLDSETVKALLGEAMAEMIAKLGTSVPAMAAPTVTVPESTALVLASPAPTTLAPPVTALVLKTPPKPKMKDNAQWHDILTVLCSSFTDELIRVLLIGPPGTGKSKTSLILTDTPYRVTMTEGMGVEDLIGMYQLVKSETVWVDGPVVRAMREGKRILIDEIDHHPTEVGSLLYALLDDNPELMLPTGEKVVAAKGYGVIATTNSNVTALPEAVLDRFEAVIPAIQPHPDALIQFSEAPQRSAVENHFRSLDATPWTWSGKPTLRRMRAFARLKPAVGESNAASLAFGTAGKELLGVLTTSARTSSL